MQTEWNGKNRSVQWHLWRGWYRSEERNLNKIDEVMNAVHRGDHRSQAIKQQLRYSWYKASNEVKRSSNAKAAEWEARCRAWTALIGKRAIEPTPERKGKRGGGQRGRRGGKERRAEIREAHHQGRRAAKGLYEEIRGLARQMGDTRDQPFPKGLLISTKYPTGPWTGDDMRDPPPVNTFGWQPSVRKDSYAHGNQSPGKPVGWTGS